MMSMNVSKCFYCSEYIDLKNDDFEKHGKKIICVFCYEENTDEIYDDDLDNDEYSDNENDDEVN